MSLPGGRRGVLAASGAAILLPVSVGSLVLAVGAEPQARPAATAIPAPSAAADAANARRLVFAPARSRTGAAAGQDPRVGTSRIRSGRRGVSILQIGDSHTAADLFTGTVRQALQQTFGSGGIGYLNVGVPHPGVRSTVLKVSASAGWTYEGVQRSAHPDAFGLSGFNASTSRAGETLSFASGTPEPYASIEIEARTGPDAGSIVVEIDDVPWLSASLAAETAGSKVLTVLPPSGGASFRKLVVRTGEAKPVTVSAVGIFRRGSGVTYSSIGFPGATVDVVNRFAEAAFAEDLRHLAPDIVVLAFGTNEGFDAKLDPAAYRDRYLSAIREIRKAVPHARLAMIGPPQGQRPAPACKPADGRPCPPPAPAAEPPASTEGPGSCPQRPAQLDSVRDVQRRLAEAERIPFWDWWAIMPAGCGASRWAAADPPLMAKDHVHFTTAGYRKGGQAFAAFIEPEVRAALRGGNAVSHD